MEVSSTSGRIGRIGRIGGIGGIGGIGCTDPNRILFTSGAKEDGPMVGIFLDSHGCQDYSILFFGAGKESGGVVWKGDICSLIEEDEDEDEDEEEEEEEDEEEVDGWNADEISWVDWLRMELREYVFRNGSWHRNMFSW